MEIIKSYHKATKVDSNKLLKKFWVHEIYHRYLLFEKITISWNENVCYLGNPLIFYNISDNLSERFKYVSLSDYLISTIDDVVREIVFTMEECNNYFNDMKNRKPLMKEMWMDKITIKDFKKVWEYIKNVILPREKKKELKTKLIDVLETQNLDSIHQYMLDIINLLKKDE